MFTNLFRRSIRISRRGESVDYCTRDSEITDEVDSSDDRRVMRERCAFSFCMICDTDIRICVAGVHMSLRMKLNSESEWTSSHWIAYVEDVMSFGKYGKSFSVVIRKNENEFRPWTLKKRLYIMQRSKMIMKDS